MNTLRPLALAATVFAAAALAPSAVFAARSYDNCTGFIDSLPATIGTQGVWCLRKNLITSITSGVGITIAENNVTIDCNDFKIGGLQAGASSLATGIAAWDRQNATVRNCGVRGFSQGISLSGGGHVVEDNRLDGNLYIGVHLSGDGNVAQRNRILDTGGSTYHSTTFGIHGESDVIDNVVDNVFSTASVDTGAFGIYSLTAGALIRDNRIRGILATGAGQSRGIGAYGAGVVVSGNTVHTPAAVNAVGVYTSGASSVCRENTVYGYATPYMSCEMSTANLPAGP